MSQDNAWTVDRVIAIIRSLAKEDELPERLIGAEITGADTIDTLGLDSIGAVSLIDRLEQEADAELPDDFLEVEDSITAIADRMNTLT